MDLTPSTSNGAGPFPMAPLEYINLFTDEYLQNCPKISVPPDIIRDEYSVFGRLHEPNDVLMRSLESQNIQRLDSKGPNVRLKPTSVNPTKHKIELKKINHSILISYLELLDVLVKAPSSETALSGDKSLRDQKLDDLEVLFKNMHHLINEMRPHQARDELICIMESQKQERVELARKFRRHLETCVAVLDNCIRSIDDEAGVCRRGFTDELNKMLAKLSTVVKSIQPTARKDDQHGKFNGFRDNEADADKLCRKINSMVVDTGARKECDFRDEVLCDLIDDLVKDF